MIRITFLGILTLVLMGCTDSSDSGPSTSPAGKRYLALGDSYTIGEGVTIDDRWPMQLVKALRAEGIEVADPQIIATTGWTTDELSAGITAADPQGPYELVTLLIGVNNQYRGRDAEEFRLEFADLLEQSIDFAGGEAGHVIVLSIPDWGVTPFGQADPRRAAAVEGEIDQFNAIAREVTERAKAIFIDITPVSRTALGDPSLSADDGLHPSGPMYAKWVQLALPAARIVLDDDTAPTPGSTTAPGRN